MMSEWKPIQSAPRDGARALLLYELGRYAIGRWDVPEPDFEGRWLDTEGDVVWNPTHWMPLPEKPSAEPPNPEDEKVSDKDEDDSEAWTLLDEWGKRPDGLHDLDLVDVRYLWDDIGQLVNVRHGVFTDRIVALGPWPKDAFAYRVVYPYRPEVETGVKTGIEVGDVVKMDPPSLLTQRYVVVAVCRNCAWLVGSDGDPFTVPKGRLRIVRRRKDGNG